MKTKRTLALLLTGVLLLAAIFPVMAQETEPSAEEPVVEATPAPLTASTDLFVTPLFRVNARSGPSTAYTIFGVVTPSDSLDISGQLEDGSWLRVNFNGQEAWVFADLMDVSGDLTAAPVAEAGASAVLRSAVTPPLLEDDSEAEETAELEILTAFNTNLRDSYTTDAAVLATIPYDTLLIPQGRTDDNNWIMVEVADQSGWVYVPLLFFASGRVDTLPVLATIPVVEEAVTETTTEE